LEDGKYDAIVCATGSREKAPAVEGVDKAVFARTLLRDVSLLDGKEKVVVVGGGTVGCEVALMLAAEYGLKVTVLEMLPTLMPHICTANRTHLIHELEKHGVTLMNCAKLEKIEDGSVAVNVNESPTVPDPYNTWNPVLPENVPNPLAKPIKEEYKMRTIDTDLVVLAVGNEQDNAFYRLIKDAYITPELYLLGDAAHTGMIMHAVRAGYRAGLSI